jgi:hypothetical protein
MLIIVASRTLHTISTLLNLNTVDTLLLKVILIVQRFAVQFIHDVQPSH